MTSGGMRFKNKLDHKGLAWSGYHYRPVSTVTKGVPTQNANTWRTKG